MLRIALVTTTYLPPDDDEWDYCPDGEGSIKTVVMSFRELVSAMNMYQFVSRSPAIGATYEWLISETEQDYRTGEYTERTMHYSEDNPPRCAKYWRLAMKAAGLLNA